MIVANNGDIVRLVGVSHVPQASGFLSFGYDTAAFEGGGSERIVPRAVKLLDYTLGGPDLANQAGPVVTGDIGAGSGASVPVAWYSGPVGPGQALGSEVHGGQGDDTVYGGAGNDVLYGDGQNDVLIGGYGNDWISGGNGDDAILGDDGRIFIDRIGINEPLFADTTGGVPAGETAKELITTPGTMQQAVINVTGAIRYTAVLSPTSSTRRRAPCRTRPCRARATRATSSTAASATTRCTAAPATMRCPAPRLRSRRTSTTTTRAGNRIGINLESDFAHPYNPGNALGYSPTATYQAQYDPTDPFREITLVAPAKRRQARQVGDRGPELVPQLQLDRGAGRRHGRDDG